MVNLGELPISIPAFLSLAATHRQPNGDLLWHVRQANGKFVPKRVTPVQAVEILTNRFAPAGVTVDLWREKGALLALDVVNLHWTAVPGMSTWTMECLFAPLSLVAFYKRREVLSDLYRRDYIRLEIQRPQHPNADYLVIVDELPGYFRQYYGGAIFALDALIANLERTVRFTDTIPALHPMLIPHKARLPLAVRPIRLGYFDRRDRFGLDELLRAEK